MVLGGGYLWVCVLGFYSWLCSRRSCGLVCSGSPFGGLKKASPVAETFLFLVMFNEGNRIV